MDTAGIALAVSITCSSAATSIRTRRGRRVIRRERAYYPTIVVPATTMGLLRGRPKDHAFIAAQIERALDLFTLPVQKCRQQDFAAEADRTRGDRNRLSAEVQRNDDGA